MRVRPLAPYKKVPEGKRDVIEWINRQDAPTAPARDRALALLERYSTLETITELARKVDARLVRGRSVRVHLGVMDDAQFEMNAALANAAAQLHAARCPSPALEVLQSAGAIRRAWESMWGAVAALGPPMPVPVRPVKRELAMRPTDTATQLEVQGDWFDAWLGHEASTADTREAASGTEDGHLRIGGSGAALMALRNRPRALGDQVRVSRSSGFPTAPPEVRESANELQWADTEIVADLDSKTAETLRVHLAHLGFGLVPATADGGHHVINALAKQLELAPNNEVSAKRIDVLQYANAGAFSAPRQVVGAARAMVAECTHRMVMCAALRGGRDEDKAPIRARTAEALDAIERVGARVWRSGASDTGMGTSDKDATARSAAVLIGNAIKAYLGERRGGNMSAVDAADELTGLYARLAHKAYQTNAYALLWPAQVARIDATIVQAADPSGAATRVQIPATQAAEYAAVAAMRESEGMDAGIDARAHWESVRRVCEELSPIADPQTPRRRRAQGGAAAGQ